MPEKGELMDHRDVAGHFRAPYRVDEQRGVIVLFDEDEEELELPLEWEVCPTCEGAGKHVNPSIDSNGISPEEFREDPDFAESYFAGHYDVPCHECNGKRVVPNSSDPRFEQAMQECWESAMSETRAREMGY